MKKILIALFVLITSWALSSCAKECYTCKTSWDTSTICEKDFDSRQDFQNAKDILEQMGYTCK